MAGQRCLLAGGMVLCLLIACAPSAMAEPREADGSIGGITFKPPRPAILRAKSGNLLRGDLVALSDEWVQFRLQSGKVFDYPLNDIRSIVTNDRAFRYNSAHDTYRKAVENARELRGVTIEEKVAPASADVAASVRTPPPPPKPVMLDSPENHRSTQAQAVFGLTSATPPGQGQNRVLGQAAAAGQPAAMPPIPVQQPTANAGVANVPVHETGAFKIGFLVACFVLILLWWRNRVG